MSVRRFSILFCDVCGEHSFDNPEETAKVARRNARENGWKVTSDGKDICEGCIEKGKR